MSAIDPQGLYLYAHARLEQLRTDAAMQTLIDQLPRAPNPLRLALAGVLRRLARYLDGPSWTGTHVAACSRSSPWVSWRPVQDESSRESS